MWTIAVALYLLLNNVIKKMRIYQYINYEGHVAN